MTKAILNSGALSSFLLFLFSSFLQFYSALVPLLEIYSPFNRIAVERGLDIATKIQSLWSFFCQGFDFFGWLIVAFKSRT